MKQLNLFSAAPGAKGTRGRSVSADTEIALENFLRRAREMGCTHLEISNHGMLLVTPAVIGRNAQEQNFSAQYIPLDSPQIRSVVREAGKTLQCRTVKKSS